MLGPEFARNLFAFGDGEGVVKTAVVIGMAANPFVGRARRALSRAGIAHHYIGFGGYLSQWRRRNALKMWSGWPTFPMVFVRGQLVGGATDLDALIASGELAERLVATHPD
jgi:glutaredoxin-related protein